MFCLVVFYMLICWFNFFYTWCELILFAIPYTALESFDGGELKRNKIPILNRASAVLICFPNLFSEIVGCGSVSRGKSPVLLLHLLPELHKGKVEVLTAVTKSSAIICHQMSETIEFVAVNKAWQLLFMCQF